MNMQKLSLTLALTLALASAHSAFASPSDELAQTQKEIKTVSANVAKLDEEEKKLRAKAKELQAQMVKTAAELQASEAELSALEEKTRILNEQITAKTAELLVKKKNLATMIAASIKLSQTPPEAIILMPGDMAENMKASRALKMTADNIKAESESIKNQMVELEGLKTTVEANKQDAAARKAKLDEQKSLLKKQMAEHYDLRKKLKNEQSAAKSRVAALAKKAGDLQSLIASLEQEKAAQIAEKKQAQEDDELGEDSRKPSGDKGKLRSFKAAKGNIRVPAAGKLSQKFGVVSKNETSKGITITTRGSAQVTAPYDAEVVFTGPFMAYGRMIILRHSDGFHTLLAGMAKIDASVGDYLLEGEPIGSMGDKEPNNRLYMELREDNEPTDPANWLRGMRK